MTEFVSLKQNKTDMTEFVSLKQNKPDMTGFVSLKHWSSEFILCLRRIEQARQTLCLSNISPVPVLDGTDVTDIGPMCLY